MAHAELTPTQFTALLKTVELGRITQNHLGRLAAMDPATIQGVVRRLIARGLVRRGRDPMDRRTAVLEPTEAGVALIGSVVACARRAHDAALAPLTAGGAGPGARPAAQDGLRSRWTPCLPPTR